MDAQNMISIGYYEKDRVKVSALVQRFPGEVVRKSLHLLIALVPPLASLNLPFTLFLLAFGVVFYSFAEASRQSGRPVFIVGDLTLIASRDRDNGKFVLGPITLGLGAMLALSLYPSPASSIAIYALAFGDGFASLAGTMLGGPKVPYLHGKTFSGSIACFFAVFFTTMALTSRPLQSFCIAAVATVLEAVPVGNYDNLVIPFGVGLAATRLLIG
jgi:phytol kinase